METIEMVPVGKLKQAEDNVRSDVGDVSELAASIKSAGVIQPLVAREGDYLVVVGARRLEAAKQAGLKEVPVVVRPFTEQQRLETMIVENLQREDLTPVEEATSFKRLADLGLKQRDIAAKVGKSQAHVAKRLSLLALPDEVRAKVDSGGIKLEDAQELAKLKDDPKLVAKVAEGSSISHRVNAELEKRDRAKKQAAAVAALKKAGENVVEVTDDGYGYQLKVPQGNALVLISSYKESDVEMDPKTHAKLKCHAVGVHPRTFDTIEVCTDPSRHENKRTKEKEEQKKQAAAQAKAREEKEAIAARRREFVQGRLVKVDKDELLELVFLTFTSDTPYDWSGNEDQLACFLLGLGEDGVIDEMLDEAGLEECEPDELLVLRAKKSQADKLRVTYAIAAAQLETTLMRWATDPSALGYLALLTKAGYEMSQLEKEQLQAMLQAQAAAEAEDDEEGLTHVEVDGTVVAKTKHVDLTEPEAEASDAA